jgi:hypothetical protein
MHYKSLIEQIEWEVTYVITAQFFPFSDAMKFWGMYIKFCFFLWKG